MSSSKKLKNSNSQKSDFSEIPVLVMYSKKIRNCIQARPCVTKARKWRISERDTPGNRNPCRLYPERPEIVQISHGKLQRARIPECRNTTALRAKNCKLLLYFVLLMLFRCNVDGEYGFTKPCPYGVYNGFSLIQHMA